MSEGPGIPSSVDVLLSAMPLQIFDDSLPIAKMAVQKSKILRQTFD
jgi:hypothetical protein